MIKHVAMMNFRPDVPRSELIDLYEREHVPLVRSLFPFLADYRRNYVVDHPAALRGDHKHSAPYRGFDVATELWYADRQDLVAMYRALEEPGIAAAIRESETRLFDLSSMTVLECEEYATPADALQPRPVGHRGRPAIKLIGLIRKKAGQTRDAFIDRYEKGHCPLALSVLTMGGKPAFADYRRTYPIAAPQLAMVPEMALAPAIDVVTEAWFWTDADYGHFLAQRADPAVDATISRDEAELFDRSSIAIYFVDERC